MFMDVNNVLYFKYILGLAAHKKIAKSGKN